MKDFKLCDINLATDKPQIGEWDKLKGTPKYENIEKFVLEDGLIHGLEEVILTNYEIIPIGDDEIKKTLVAKTKDNEILGMLIYQVFGLTTKEPEMFLQYVVVNPNYQGKGYGSAIFAEFFTNIQKYANGCTPKEVFAPVDVANFHSQTLFMNFGFTLNGTNTNLMQARANLPQIQKRIQEQYATKS